MEFVLKFSPYDSEFAKLVTQTFIKKSLTRPLPKLKIGRETWVHSVKNETII